MTENSKSDKLGFSIIVPTFNRAKNLESLLASLLLQTFKTFEVLICDDGSTDNTKEVILKFKDKLDLRYFHNTNSGGPARPRNVGIQNAKYEWICFLDSDDFWLDNKLEVLCQSILSNKNYKLFCHPAFIIQSNVITSKVIGNYRKGFLLNDFESLLYNGSQIVNSTLCVKKEIISEEFKFDTSPEYHGIEDYIFLIRLTEKNNKVKKIDKILGYYRVHSGNISADTFKQISKCTLFFTNNFFLNIDNSKIHSLLLYMHLSLGNRGKLDTIKKYLSLIFIKRGSFEIKIKSAVKLFLFLLKLKPI